MIVDAEPKEVSQSIDAMSTDVEITDLQGETSILTVVASAEQSASIVRSKAWVDEKIQYTKLIVEEFQLTITKS